MILVKRRLGLYRVTQNKLLNFGLLFLLMFLTHYLEIVNYKQAVCLSVLLREALPSAGRTPRVHPAP